MKNMISRIMVLLLPFKLLILTAAGQAYYFRHYEVEDGISNNTVFCSTQDSMGFMWFGTKDGLNRFDGYQFKIFQPSDNSSHNTDYIFSLTAANNGNLWVGSMSGLYRFNARTEKIEPVIDSLNYIWDIQKDNKNRLWFISGYTVCRLNLNTGKLMTFSPATYFKATSLCKTDDGTIWISTTDGFIAQFNENSGQFKTFDLFNHSPKPTRRRIEVIYPGGNAMLYAGTQSQGLKAFDITDKTYEDILVRGSQENPLFIRDILQYKTNELWLATESGIYILNTKTNAFQNLKKDYANPYSLNDNAIYTLSKDNEGNIWAGSYFGGVNYYAKRNAIFTKYFPNSKTNAISGNIVGDICIDHKGHLWIATEDNGINKIDRNTGKITQYIPSKERGSLSYGNIHALVALGNELWIGTYQHGIDVLDINSGTVIKHYAAGPQEGKLKSNFPYSFLYTKSHQLYIGTTAGVFRYDRDKDNFHRIPVIDGNVYGKAMIEDHTGKIWIGAGTNGMYWFDPASGKSAKKSCLSSDGNSLAGKIINDIYEDSANNIWIATEGGGVCRLNSDRTSCDWYTTGEGFPVNFVFKILEDNENKLWLSSSRGLIQYNPVTRKTKVFTQASGLLSDQFNRHSGFKDKNGRLYFGSARGLISFLPSELEGRHKLPPVYITGFQIFDKDLIISDKPSATLQKSLIYTKQLTLSHNQSSISIDFAALSYIAPKMTKYRYRLLGLSKQWTTINQDRRAYFTNLTPGNYTFEVNASLGNNWNNKEIKRLHIIVKPPLWMTNWAISFYFLVGIFLLYILIKSFQKRQQTKKEKEIYKSKSDFFANVSHEIRTPLTLIKGPVETLLENKADMPDYAEDLECLDRNTNRLMDLAMQILDFRKTEIKNYTLYFEEINLNDILQEIFLSFKWLAKKRGIAYHLMPHKQMVRIMADKDALQKILSNLIGNAVKYADHYVQIAVSSETKKEHFIKIILENDGIPVPENLKEKVFDPFFRIKDTHHQKGTGIGLSLARSLTELHKGKLYMDPKKRQMNRFILLLPLSHK